MKSYIYIIGGNSPPYKIGFSANPHKRLASLQTGYPSKLFLHYTEELKEYQVRSIEKYIHKMMNYKRTHGEWFDLELKEAINEVKFAIIRNIKD